MPSVKLLALGKVTFFSTPLVATLSSVFPYALGKVTKFFLIFHFSLFFYTNTKKISKYMEITGSYYNKYIIDNYENNTDTNNTSDYIYHKSDR